MKKQKFCIAAALLAAFVLWTVAIKLIDVQAIGPGGTSVGFAALNGFVHGLSGTHMTLYTITDWFGLVPVACCLGFTVLGLIQWIKRRSILKVDRSILLLGGFYIVTFTAYLFFESHVINYRPVLIAGYPEPSYPSSTTLLVLCVMPTARMQFRRCVMRPVLYRCLSAAITVFTVFTVAGRLVSGVHWLTDIVGGVLLSAGLVMMYDALM